MIHVGGVATVRIGDNFGDDVYNSSLTQDACYKLSNHLGSVSFRTRSSGSKVDVEEYYPFGDSSLRTWEKKRYRYVGKEKDQESGLYYYGARYYAAWTCRFISTDPLALEYPFYTPYQYAGNKPINFIDLDGLEEFNPNEGEGSISPGQTNDDNIVHSKDGNRIYNVSKDNRSWDFGIFNSDTGMYDLHCISDSTMLDIFNDDSMGPRVDDGSYGNEIEQDAANTINAIWRSQEVYEKSYQQGLLDYRLTWRDRTRDDIPSWVVTEEESTMGDGWAAVKAFWAETLADTPNYPPPSYFGERIKTYSGRADPDEFGNAILLLGFTAVAKVAMSSGGYLKTLGAYGSEQEVLEMAANLRARSGYFDVVIHGASNGKVFMRNGISVTPEQLYAEMLEAGYQQGTRIRLMSYYTGKLPTGAAAQLSKLAESQVMAPRGWVTVFSGGKGAIFPKGHLAVGDVTEGSKWAVFYKGSLINP